MMKTKVIAMLFVFIMVFCTVFMAVQSPVIARAESTSYSNVLDDLKKDSSFDESNYPLNIEDYSLQLIQIAEGVDGDVFVYVYQPSADAKDYHASSINVSLSINNALSPRNYKLEYCNSHGVFFKYKILNLKVANSNLRYYTVVSIFRPFDETVDTKPGGGNTISEVAYGVSRQYAFGTVNGEPYAECVDIETIEVTDKFVGFVRYDNGMTWMTMKDVDSHFVAFNTDKPIDKLLEADVYFTTQQVKFSENILTGDKYDFYEIKENYVTLNYLQKAQNENQGWFANTYTWDRIQTVDDFIATEDRSRMYNGAVLDVNVSSKLSDDALNNLKGKKWVLRFTETSYSYSHPATGANLYYFTEVGNVSILRLKFETDGQIYNLGAIDNKQTGSKDPVNDTEVDIELNERGKTLLYLLMIVLLLALLSPILPYIVKGFLWIITLPSKTVAKAKEKQKKPEEDSKNKNEKSKSDK